jgi:hypothetical protein
MVVDRLAALVSEHLDDLPPYAWASESDRWCELLTCLLHVRLPSRTYAEVRDMVHQLREVDTLLRSPWRSLTRRVRWRCA